MRKIIVLWMMLGLIVVPAVAQQGKLVINELLYQPLSGEAEYVELYNNSESMIELADYHIVRWVGDSLGKHYPLPHFNLLPHGYVLLTKEVASVTANYTVHSSSNLLECDLPTYPNAGGSVIVATADSSVVDRLDYTPSMHSRLLRDKAGVSLERRSADRPTDDAGNWFSASSTAGYGTPGYANSQSTEWLVEETSFGFSSTLLSPDGDGYQDELMITYRLDDNDLAARAEVYTARGLRVHRLMNNELLGTHGTLVWNGCDDNGTPLPEGQYVILITLYNTQGAQQTLRRRVALVR